VLAPHVLTTFVSGLILSLSLIVAVGAQNAFVLRQGALRQHVPTIVTICALSDVALIEAGVAGGSAALGGRRWLLALVKQIGIALLLGYGALAARRAVLGLGSEIVERPSKATRATVIAACLAFTWLNPAVYLDTVVLLGSVANAQPGREWWFGGGAALGSALWFVALGFAAGLLSPLLRRPAAWRALDAFVAVVMATTALRLVLTG
jgi:L-lysine exporter family protein LysE/ArgO